MKIKDFFSGPLWPCGAWGDCAKHLSDCWSLLTHGTYRRQMLAGLFQENWWFLLNLCCLWNLDLEALRLNGLPEISAPHWRTWVELRLPLVNFWGPGNLAGLDFETYTSEENKAIYKYTIAVGAHRNRIYIYIFTTTTIDYYRTFQISPFGLLNKYPENFYCQRAQTR